MLGTAAGATGCDGWAAGQSQGQVSARGRVVPARRRGGVLRCPRTDRRPRRVPQRSKWEAEPAESIAGRSPNSVGPQLSGAPTQRGTNSAKHQPPGREMRGLSVRQGFEALDERHSGGVDLPCPLSGLLPSGAAQQTVQPEQESSVRGECGPRGDMDAWDCGFHGFT